MEALASKEEEGKRKMYTRHRVAGTAQGEDIRGPLLHVSYRKGERWELGGVVYG